MKLELDLSALMEAVRPLATSGHLPLSLTIGLPQLPPRELPVEPISLGEQPVVDAGGKEITWTEFEAAEGPGSLLQKDGQQIMMYMPGHYLVRYENALLDGTEGNKIHVAFCSHLEKMKTSGKFDSKYFVTQDLHGTFRIYENGGLRDDDAELKVCKLCLRKLNYKGYLAPGRGKSDIFQNFSYESFFEEYGSFFPHHPMHNLGNERDRGYTKDWSKISQTYRASRHYTCEACEVDLNDHRNLLHTHHLNAVSHDNREENLRALCIDCHSKQPQHNHLPVSHENRQLIAHLRRFQQSIQTDDWPAIFRYADPGLNGVLYHLQHNAAPLPELGLEVRDNNQTVIARLDLAWPFVRVGIAISSSDADAVKAQGWSVFSVEQALAMPESLLRTLRQTRYA